MVTEDALSTLRNAMPERLSRFADRYMVDLDAQAAAVAVGAPGEARTLLSDRRVLTYIGALCGQLRNTHAELRSQMVGMLTHMALYDPAGAIGPAGWLPFEQWPANLRMCVESLTFHESGALKQVKWVRRLDVIDRLLALTGSVDKSILPRYAKVVFESEVG
jgi:hypothetical protein